jgi:hypothetical protein
MMATAAEETLEYDVGADENEATVSMNEDGSEAAVDDAAAEASTNKEDELDQYSEGVQKRINKLTARLREHQRREQAALEYAKSVQQRAADLENRFRETDSARMGEAKNRIDTQIVALKQIIKKAREEGDMDTETEAQERLTSVQWEKRQLEDASRAYAAQRQAAPQQQQPVYQQPIQQPQRQADPKAEEWAERNPWFGKDTVMTHAVWGVHKDLIQKEGFDPASDEYYDELDKRMRSIFPGKFDASGRSDNRATNKPVQTVAPATRSSGVTNTARRSVRLSASQVAIAKKLGVPLEEYAKYVKE